MADEQEDASIVLHEALRGGLVTTPELAVKLAELLLVSAYDEQRLEQQKPLIATDQGDRWLIEGSYNKDGKIEGIGPAKIIMLKRNAQVLYLAIPRVMHLSPEMKEYVKQAQERNRKMREGEP